MRSFPSFRGQRNNTGWWWCATNRRHVGFESWLERDHVIRLDFAPDVIGLASQPFWLTWDDGRRAFGTLVLVLVALAIRVASRDEREHLVLMAPEELTR